jgi:hypothetical protein
MQAELTEMVGAKVYDRLVAVIRERDHLRVERVALPHPAVRRRDKDAAKAKKAAASVAEAAAAT